MFGELSGSKLQRQLKIEDWVGIVTIDWLASCLLQSKLSVGRIALWVCGFTLRIVPAFVGNLGFAGDW